MLSAEEIARVKADWEEKQKRKAEKVKGNETEKEKGDDKNSAKPKDEPSQDKTIKTPPKATSPALTPQQPSHEKYALHRDLFALRTAEHRRRRQTAQAKELAPRLPGAPRSAVS